MKNEIVLFTDGDINIEVELSPELETVWLTQKQMPHITRHDIAGNSCSESEHYKYRKEER